MSSLEENLREPTQNRKSLRVLVGDDQIGIRGSLHQKSFLRNYATIDAHFDFAAEEQEFIEKAKTGNYDALLIDLNWTREDEYRTEKTGYRVLATVHEYAPIRAIHTSDTQHSARALDYGATHCIEKHGPAAHMQNTLYGGKRKMNNTYGNLVKETTSADGILEESIDAVVERQRLDRQEAPFSARTLNDVLAEVYKQNAPNKKLRAQAEFYEKAGNYYIAAENRTQACECYNAAAKIYERHEGPGYSDEQLTKAAALYERAGERERAKELWLMKAKQIDCEPGSYNAHEEPEEDCFTAAHYYELAGEKGLAKAAEEKGRAYYERLKR